MRTVAQTKKWAIETVRKQSPNATIEWTLPLERRKFPTGLVQVYGHMKVRAQGFNTRTFKVWSDDSGIGMN